MYRLLKGMSGMMGRKEPETVVSWLKRWGFLPGGAAENVSLNLVVMREARSLDEIPPMRQSAEQPQDN